MSAPLDPRIYQVLDGDLSLEALPPELRAEAAAALRLLATVDRRPVALHPGFSTRVMAAVRQRPAARRFSVWLAWFTAPQDVHVRVRPALVGAALLALLALGAWLVRPRTPAEPALATTRLDSVAVRFVLYAPEAHAVAVAGTFNQWDAAAAPLLRTDPSGVWTATLVLPPGEHQYTFVVDGQRFVPDPAAPAVDDGFGRKNSVMAVPAPGRSL